MFARLLRDRESEVRALSCQILVDVAAVVRQGLDHLVPTFEAMASDSSNGVRMSFAGSLVALCSIVGKVGSVSKKQKISTSPLTFLTLRMSPLDH